MIPPSRRVRHCEADDVGVVGYGSLVARQQIGRPQPSLHDRSKAVDDDLAGVGKRQHDDRCLFAGAHLQREFCLLRSVVGGDVPDDPLGRNLAFDVQCGDLVAGRRAQVMNDHRIRGADPPALPAARSAERRR